MLNFVLGRNGSGKTEYLRNNAAEKLLKGENECIFIVPEQFSFESERSMLIKVGASKMLRLEIFSFTRLSHILNEKYGEMKNPPITDGVCSVLMSMTLDGLKDKLEFYKNFSGKPALIAQLITFSDELKKCGVQPSELSQTAKDTDNLILKTKLKELSLITSLYGAQISSNYSDSRDMLTIAADLIAENNYFFGKTVYIDAFSGFTVQERKIIAQIMKQADNVYVSLCTDCLKKSESGFSLFDNVTGELQKLISCAAEMNVKVSKPVILSAPAGKKSKDLEHLEKFVFSRSQKKFDGESKNIILCAAGNKTEEADFVACKIKKLLRTKKFRCREIAVIERTQNNYDKELNESFKKYGIPYFEDKRQPILAQPVIIFVNCLLSMAQTGISTETLFRYLKTGLTEVSDGDISELENYAVIWKIDGSKWKNDFTENPEGLGVEFNEKTEKRLAHFNRIRKQIIAPVLAFKRDFFEADGTEKSRLIYNYLKYNKITDRLSEFSVGLLKSGNSLLAYEQDTVWQLLMQMLDNLSVVIGETVITPKRYYELFSILLSTATLGSIPQNIDAVTIGSADRMRIAGCRAVFIIGANSGVFPLDLPTDGILNDRERKILEKLGLELTKTAEYKTVDERFFAYCALTGAAEKVYISYSLSDYSGKAMFPSEIVSEINNIFPDIRHIDTALIDPIERIESTASAFELAAEKFDSDTVLSVTLNKYFNSLPEYSDRLSALNRIISQKEMSISDKAVAIELFGKSMYVSASRCETYYKCPFEYFCKYGLNAKPRKAAELDPAQSGTVIHYVLEKILGENTKAQLELFSDAKLKEKIKDIMDGYLAGAMGGTENKPKRFIYLYSRLLGTLFEVVKRIIEELKVSDFTPSDFELSIDKDGEISPYEVPLPNGGSIYIRGSVDRVDTMQKDGKTYVRVIDYKSGGKKFMLSDIFSGLNMQMMIYLFAIRQNGAEKYGDIVPSGVLYMPAKQGSESLGRDASQQEILSEKLKSSRLNGIVLYDENVIRGMDRTFSKRYINVEPDKKNGGFKGDLLKLEELGRLQKRVNEELVKMAGYLQNGIIPVLPAAGGNYKNTCEYCDYSQVCSFETSGKTREISTFTLSQAIAILNNDGDGEQNV